VTVVRATSAEVAPKEVELTIVMPCLNEAKAVGRCVAKARRFLEEQGVCGEVVVADNGSTDGSREIALAEGARVVEVPLPGYGVALHHGVLAANGRYIIMGDSDDSYDFSRLGGLLEALRKGGDLVMGNRFRGGIRPGAMPWKNRYIGNPVLSLIGRVFFRASVADFHCGLRGVSRAAYERMGLVTAGMEYASEMVIKATLFGMRIVEVPVTLDKDLRDRPPHLRPWRDGWRHLRFMLLYSPRWLFFYPGLLLMMVGGLLGARLVAGPLIVGPLFLDVHTLLYAASAVLLGFQLVAFSFFARIFSVSEGLAPEDPQLTRLFRFFTLEVGLIVGVVMALAGLGGSIATVFYWRGTHYGQLDPSVTFRAAIPSMTALTLGCQIVFSSFFLSVLGLRKRRQ